MGLSETTGKLHPQKVAETYNIICFFFVGFLHSLSPLVFFTHGLENNRWEQSNLIQIYGKAKTVSPSLIQVKSRQSKKAALVNAMESSSAVRPAIPNLWFYTKPPSAWELTLLRVVYIELELFFDLCCQAVYWLKLTRQICTYSMQGIVTHILRK